MENKISENYKAWFVDRKGPEEFWSLATDEERQHYLCSLAHLAANSHNTQPWIFIYSKYDQTMTLCLEVSRVLPASDVVGRQAVISLGCALANYEVAAEALGVHIEKTYLNPAVEAISNQLERPIPFIKIKISGKNDQQVSTVQQQAMYQAIFTRRVDRGEYDHNQLLPSDLLRKIEMLGSDLKVRTILITDWGRKVALAELQAQADAFVINNKEFSTELVNDWMLDNNSNAGLGMPGNTFRLNDEQTKKIKFRFESGLGFESDDAVALSQQGKKGILSCPCVGMLVVEKDEPLNWLHAGVVLERGALLLESEGLAWAVHAGLAEVKQVNMFMLRPIAMTTQRPVILFRAGYLKKNETRSPHSPRLDFSKVWKVL